MSSTTDVCEQASAHVSRGDALAKEGQLADARAAWYAAAQLVLPLVDEPGSSLPPLCATSAVVSHWRLAALAEQHGDPRTAALLYAKAVEIDERFLPPTPTTAYLARCAGRRFRASGDYEMAMQLARRAVELRRGVEPGSVDLSRDLNDLGTLQLAVGDFEATVGVFTEAVEICAAAAPDGPDMAASLNSLGQAHWKRGDPEAALEYHLRALKIDEALDPDGVDTATSLNNVGLMYKMLGDLPKARTYYERALEIDGRLDPDSVETARDLQNLAKVHRAYAELLEQAGERTAAGARQLEYAHMRQALMIVEERAPGSIEHAHVLNATGDAAHGLGDSAVAARLYGEANSIVLRLAPGSDLARAIQENLMRLFAS